MAQSSRGKAVLFAGLVDTGLVVYRGFKGKQPSKLPPPGEFPLIGLLYGVLFMISDTETVGQGAVALAWLLVLANALHLGNPNNLITDLGGPASTAKGTTGVTAPTPPKKP